jgi:hypothetical protein
MLILEIFSWQRGDRLLFDYDHHIIASKPYSGAQWSRCGILQDRVKKRDFHGAGGGFDLVHRTAGWFRRRGQIPRGGQGPEAGTGKVSSSQLQRG